MKTMLKKAKNKSAYMNESSWGHRVEHLCALPCDPDKDKQKKMDGWLLFQS